MRQEQQQSSSIRAATAEQEQQGGLTRTIGPGCPEIKGGGHKTPRQEELWGMFRWARPLSWPLLLLLTLLLSMLLLLLLLTLLLSMLLLLTLLLARMLWLRSYGLYCCLQRAWRGRRGGALC